MTITTHDVEQRSDEWYALRRGIVTASNVGKLITSTTPDPRTIGCPACSANAGDPCVSRARREPTEIATVHQVRSALAATLPPVLKLADNDMERGLILSLAAERITGRTDDTYQSRDMLRGQLDEPLARAVYAEHYTPVEEVGFVTREFDGCTFGASPDGLVGPYGVLEIKSRRQAVQVGHVIDGEIPSECMAQVQGVMYATGRFWCHYVTYSSGMPLYLIYVAADPAWFAAIVAAVQDAEARIQNIVSDYYAAVEGCPVTEYVDHFEEIEVA